jgi:hypothetical protein
MKCLSPHALAHSALPRQWARSVVQSGTLAGARQLLVVHPDFTDDIEIRPVGLEHEKFPHNCWLKNNVADVEIVRNHLRSP